MAMKNKEPLKPELKKAAGELIEESVFWHTCGIASRHTSSGHPVTGAGAGIEWQGRFFIVTANHVIKEFSDSDLEFVFRPPGTLERSNWWQSHTPGAVRLMMSQTVPLVARYCNPKYDLAALEVRASTVEGRIRFHKLRADSKVVRPMKNTLCAIGVPFDSYERLGAQGVAFSPYALWGNAVPIGRKWKSQVNLRAQMLMEFPPAQQGRQPHGFSGAGAWYQDPSSKPGRVWVPTLVLAGIITHYLAKSAVLQVCRVERLVDFLGSVTKPFVAEKQASKT